MITENKITDVQKQIRLALSKIERENNVRISFGACRYTNTEYGVRMTVKTTEKTEAVKKANKSKNLLLSKSYGFTKNIIGKQFTSNGKTHTITEFKTRNRKYPIITQASDGRSYKFPPSSVKRLLS